MSESSTPGDGIVDRLVAALHAQDKSRPRSRQVQVGPSEVGGCRAKVWHKVNGSPVVNPGTLRLAAVYGTAIHEVIHDALRSFDPWMDRYELEIEVSYDGLTGHVDCYDKQAEEVWDWKTTTKKNLAYFPSKQQRWQVQLYAFMLDRQGRPVKRVGLLGIPRDGNEDDLVAYSEDYDPQVAWEALEWLADVVAREQVPDPERDAVSFCRNYCEFFGEGSCLGKHAGAAAAEEPPLPADAADTVRLFVQAREDQEAASRRVEALRGALEGVSGRTEDGWAVKWSTRSGSTVDRDAVKAALGEVPMKPGKESLVLSVTRKGE